MAYTNQTLFTRLQESFPEYKTEIAHKEVIIEIPAKNLVSACLKIRDELGFEQLVDLCGVDYSTYGQADWDVGASSTGFSRAVSHGIYKENREIPRFAAVIHLLSIQHNQRLRIRTFAEGELPCVPSVTSIWNAAEWYEREAFDMYGVLFEGHTDLRRILTDYGFVGHPFRKDFPLSGQVEMRYDPDKQRVVYEPVSIEPRVLVPRVIRHDNRHAVTESKE